MTALFVILAILLLIACIFLLGYILAADQSITRIQPTGATGVAGPTGRSGPPGNAGGIGPFGPASTKIGPTGPGAVMGPVGAKGAVGIAGMGTVTGPTGGTGPTGPDGILIYGGTGVDCIQFGPTAGAMFCYYLEQTFTGPLFAKSFTPPGDFQIGVIKWHLVRAGSAISVVIDPWTFTGSTTQVVEFFYFMTQSIPGATAPWVYTNSYLLPPDPPWQHETVFSLQTSGTHAAKLEMATWRIPSGPCTSDVALGYYYWMISRGGGVINFQFVGDSQLVVGPTGYIPFGTGEQAQQLTAISSTWNRLSPIGFHDDPTMP